MRIKRYRGIAIPCRIKVINDDATEATESEYWETESTRGRSPCSTCGSDSEQSVSSWETIESNIQDTDSNQVHHLQFDP